MNVGAFITAAGLSSRINEFKPPLTTGIVPAAKRIIQTFRDAGIADIVVVTGNNAAKLESCLNHLALIFLLNRKYKQTEMFDSVKIALEYMKDNYQKIVFTPVDVPFFTAETVMALVKNDAQVTIPVYNNKKGHPIALEGSAAAQILNYHGSGGLRGAIKNLSLEVDCVDVNDSGIIYDMDTQYDYKEIVGMYNSN